MYSKSLQVMPAFILWLALISGTPVSANDDTLFSAGHEPARSLIVIEAPMEYEKISGPVDIRIRFDKKNGVEMDLDTLEFRYGLFKVNITSRIMRHAKIIKNILLVKGAKIPPGKHKIFMRVRDMNGVKHERKFKLHIMRTPKNS